MNQQQTKYTLARVDLVLRQKLDALRTACAVKAKKLTDTEMVELIKTKKVKMKDVVDRDRGSYFQLTDLYDFSKHMWFDHLNADYAPGVAALEAQAHKVRDEIVLGDNAAALELLRAFEA